MRRFLFRYGAMGFFVLAGFSLTLGLVQMIYMMDLTKVEAFFREGLKLFEFPGSFVVFIASVVLTVICYYFGDSS